MDLGGRLPARDIQKENQLLLAVAEQQLIRANDQLLRQGLKHPKPHFRLVAAVVAGQRRRPLQSELADLITDEEPLVRQAARAALVSLYRKKVDFGPLPLATDEQVQESQDEWRKYVKRNSR